MKAVFGRGLLFLLYGCAHIQKQEQAILHFPKAETKTQAIASYLQRHGEDGGSGAKCRMFTTDMGPLTLCHVDMNKPYDYSDDIFYFGFQTANHLCIDYGLDDALDDILINGTTTPVAVKDTKPEFQEFVLYEFNTVITKTYREIKKEGFL